MFSLTVRQIIGRASAVPLLENNYISEFRYVNFSQVTAAKPKPLPLEYSVEEVKVPSVGGVVAGKLWQGRAASAGDSDVPILCMHGWLDNAGSFDTLLPLIMKPRMTVLAIDFPGHGHSSHVAPVHYDAHIECMLAMQSVIRHYGWDKFTILGHSLGAIVGFVFAGVFPETVHQFIAMENVRPIPRDCKKELRYAISKIMEVERRARKAPPSYEYDELIQRFYDGRGGTISMDGCKLLMQRGAKRLANNRFEFTHDIKTAMPTGLWRFSPSQTEEIATSIKCPVCFIKGEPGGDYEARENYDRIVDLMRLSAERVEYHGIPGTHHFHLNDPYPVAPIITQFLDS